MGATAKTPETPKTPEQIIADLQAELAASKEIISGQAEQLQAAEAGAAEGRPVVTHDKKHYRVLVKQFYFNGVEIKAAELKDKTDLVKELVEKESGVLQLITKAEADAEAKS